MERRGGGDGEGGWEGCVGGWEGEGGEVGGGWGGVGGVLVGKQNEKL